MMNDRLSGDDLPIDNTSDYAKSKVWRDKMAEEHLLELKCLGLLLTLLTIAHKT